MAISYIMHCVNICIGVCGLSGNIIAYMGFLKQSKKTSTSILFQALAIADSFVIITICSIIGVAIFARYNQVQVHFFVLYTIMGFSILISKKSNIMLTKDIDHRKVIVIGVDIEVRHNVLGQHPAR